MSFTVLIVVDCSSGLKCLYLFLERNRVLKTKQKKTTDPLTSEQQSYLVYKFVLHFLCPNNFSKLKF